MKRYIRASFMNEYVDNYAILNDLTSGTGLHPTKNFIR